MGTRAIRYARSIYEIVSAFLDRCILPPPYVHTYPIDFSLSPRKVYQPTCETDRDQRFSGFHKLRSLPRNRADNIIIANNVIVLPFLSSPSFYRFSIRISLYSRYEQFGHACIRRTKNRNILFFKFTRDSPFPGLHFPPVTAVREEILHSPSSCMLERIFSYSRFPRMHTRPDSIERHEQRKETRAGYRIRVYNTPTIS